MKRILYALILAAFLPLAAQAPKVPINSPIFRAFDANGKPLSGGKLYTYAAGTSTPLATYSDAGAVTANSNPVILDSTGSAKIFLGYASYKFLLQDANGVQQWTVDNISGAPPVSSVTNVFGRTGAITAVTGDYTCGQITGAVCAIPTIFYQTVLANGGTLTQRAGLNIIGGTGVSVSCADNSINQRTDCTVALSGTAPTARTCGANGCYQVGSDGTIRAWGTVSAGTGGTGPITTAITFPTTFTVAPTLVVSGGSDADATDDAYVVFHKNITTTGATAVLRCTVNVGGSGCPSISVAVPIHWEATGY